MKKSEIYNLAQIAVVASPCIAPEKKLEIIRVLMDEEEMQKFIENQKAKVAAAE